MKTTVAVFSSSCRHGNTGKLMDRVASALEMEMVDLWKKALSPYDYEHRHRDGDSVLLFVGY